MTIAVTWSSPASDGGSAVTGYTATAEDSSSNTFYCTTDETGTGCTIEGLTNGVEYSVTIVATNENGNGTPTSPIAVTPNVVPGAPTLVSAIAGNATIAVTWSAGSNSGTAITGYTATATDAEENTATCSAGGSATTCTISSGLTNGTEYTVTVVGPDGSTTATVLGEALYSEGLKCVSAGRSPMVVTRGIRKAVDAVKSLLEKMSVKVEGKEHLPTSGPVILAANHRSFLDSIFIPLLGHFNIDPLFFGLLVALNPCCCMRCWA